MLKVYTWEPYANSGKLLLCLHENGVPFTHAYIDLSKGEHFSTEFPAIHPDAMSLHPADSYWRFQRCPDASEQGGRACGHYC